MGSFDTSSFADKILAASSLASEGLEGEVEFALTDEALNSSSTRENISKYAEEHSREGFAFDGCVSIRAVRPSRRVTLVTGAPVRPIEERVRDLLILLSEMGRLEDLVQYVLVHATPREPKMFYTQSEESKDMDPAIRERLRQLESKWAEMPELGRQLLTVTFLIENDNSYEIEVEKAEGPLKGKESQAKDIVNSIFQSRLKLVRSYTK
ncbi:MAG: hypothetical protein NTX81_06140 [Candidatus Bathyarchaeota archaeon]|nr:hypothetical protein [Candidatus Bathyarchaeota archaeon]